jgi:hypothetical protein
MLIRVGFPEGLPGYEMLPNAELRVDVPAKKKMVECLQAGLNAKFVWEAYPAKRVVQNVIDNSVDVAFPMGFTDERAAQMLQSKYTWENFDYFLSLRRIDPSDKSLRIAARLGSPQHTDYAAQGYDHITALYSYKDLVRTLTSALVDVVIVPQSVYEDQKEDWPSNTIITMGRQRNTGFYLNKADPKGLLEPINRSIERCRAKAATK